MNSENKKKLIILTGVSCSGKTTLQEELLKRGWKRPINFTTRQPRSDDELDEYVFLTEEQFFLKLRKGDFMEHTNYGDHWYGVSKNLPGDKTCVVLDPVGKTQVVSKMVSGEDDVDLRCFFLEIDKKTQRERLEGRGDSEEEIEKREKDFSSFLTQQNDIIINSSWSVSILADLIENYEQ